jgi:hypothetical protein
MLGRRALENSFMAKKKSTTPKKSSASKKAAPAVVESQDAPIEAAVEQPLPDDAPEAQPEAADAAMPEAEVAATDAPELPNEDPQGDDAAEAVAEPVSEEASDQPEDTAQEDGATEAPEQPDQEPAAPAAPEPAPAPQQPVQSLRLSVVASAIDRYVATMSKKLTPDISAGINAMGTITSGVVEVDSDEMFDLVWKFFKTHKDGLMAPRYALRGIDRVSDQARRRIEIVYHLFYNAVVGTPLTVSDEIVIKQLSYSKGARPIELLQRLEAKRSKQKK